MPIDYEKIRKIAYKKNVDNVCDDLDKGRLNTKISNFCALHDIKGSYVRDQIRSNKIIACLFAIDPSKQKLHERLAAFYIESLDGVESFQQLPNAKLVVAQGQVMTRKEYNEQGGYAVAKTIDFQWIYQGKTFYAAHKHTKEDGGGQGNQYKDLQNFIKEALGNTLADTYFIAIADGLFYEGQNGQVGKTRMDTMIDMAKDSDNVFACSTDNIEKLLKDLTQ